MRVAPRETSRNMREQSVHGTIDRANASYPNVHQPAVGVWHNRPMIWLLLILLLLMLADPDKE
jgi:hypothetical protein